MTGLYRFLDIATTVTEALALHVVTACFCKRLRFENPASRLLLTIPYAVLLFVLAKFTGLGAFKLLALDVCTIGLIKLVYKEPLYYAVLVITIINTVFSFFPDAALTVIMEAVYHGDTLVWTGGELVYRWTAYVLYILFQLVMLGIVYRLMKNFSYRISFRDFMILLVNFLFLYIVNLLQLYRVLNLRAKDDIWLNAVIAGWSVLFTTLFLYSRNMSWLEEQERQNQIQLDLLKKRHAYYEEKLKDEERIKSIYHDLKNHLLVMEGQAEAGETAAKLREQIADYENYVHTGNEFLDIILKDKAGKARDKGIDFSAVADFHGVDFIEPLDISTIFGNALDNAIEASEKLPKERRLVTVKAERVRDMLVILVENNALPEPFCPEGTTKQDAFAHGYGLPNIRKAVAKYGGCCTAGVENGVFTLKVVLPVVSGGCEG